MLIDCDDIVLDVDPEQRIHRVSNQFSSWHEFASEPLAGRDICDLLPPDARPGLRHRLVEIAEGRTCCARLPATAIDTGHLSFTASLTCVASRTGSVAVTLNPTGRQATVTARGGRLSTTGALVLEGVAAGKASNALAARLHLSSPGSTTTSTPCSGGSAYRTARRWSPAPARAAPRTPTCGRRGCLRRWSADSVGPGRGPHVLAGPGSVSRAEVAEEPARTGCGLSARQMTECG